MNEIAGYIPSIGEEFTYKTLSFERNGETLDIQVPVLTKDQMNKVALKVKKESSDVLKTLSVSEIIDIVDNVIEQLLDRTNEYRQKAEQLLPIVTGYDEELVKVGLTSYLKTFRKQNLQRFLVEDFGNPLLLDDFQPRSKKGFSKAMGPDLTVHVWAGNVPALPLWSLISGLLVKSGTIGKVASSEPLFAGWFAKLLVEVEPRLADCLAIVWWRGGEEGTEKNLFRQADVVVGYGGNESLESIKNRIPITTRFLPFGHKISFGIVSNMCLDPRKAWNTAHLAALDVVRYDQQGCYSPHVFYVQQGGKVSPKEFARYLAHELESFEKRYPRRTLSIEEEASLAEWRGKEELTVFSKPENELLGSPAGTWTVVYEGTNADLTPSSLNRVIKVITVEKLEEIPLIITPYRSYLQTVGIASTPKELFALSHLLGNAGVTRITAIGHMTSPEAGWHHDGRNNLLDLVNLVDIEQIAEEYAETFASYVD
jgi:hypothetical protein